MMRARSGNGATVGNPSPPAARGFALPFSALAATGVALAFRVWYASFRPLLPDEAYYWVWTRHLAAGYFDHPPMVAYLIWASPRASSGESASGGSGSRWGRRGAWR